MTINTISNNIIIDNNTFDYGNIGGTVFSHDTCMSIDANCTITNNYISGINANGNHITLFDSSSVITENTFIRGSTVIANYINGTNSGHDHFIVNNVFDNPTVDGSNENLVVNLSSNSIYHTNKNQTAYEAIYKIPYINNRVTTPFTTNDSREFNNYVNFGTAGEGLNMQYAVQFAQPSFGAQFGVVYGSSFVVCSGFIVPGTFSSINNMLVQFNGTGDFYQVINATGSGSNVTGFQLQAGGTSPTSAAATPYSSITDNAASAKFYMTGSSQPLTAINTPTTPIGTVIADIDINEILPPNVQILSLAIGIYCSSGASAISGGEVFLGSSTSQSAQYALSALSGTIVDVRISPDAIGYPGQITNSFTIGTGGGQITPTQLANNTQYVTLDTSALPNYVTGKNKIISALYFLSININVPGSVLIIDSPLTVRYRW